MPDAASLWKEVESDPEYMDLNQDDVQSLRNDFFFKHIVNDRDYLALTSPEDREQAKLDFVYKKFSPGDVVKRNIRNMIKPMRAGAKEWVKGAATTFIKEPLQAWKHGDLPGMVKPITGMVEGLADQYNQAWTSLKGGDIATAGVEAVPFFGPQLSEANKAYAQGDYTTATKLATQMLLDAAALKLAPPVIRKIKEKLTFAPDRLPPIKEVPDKIQRAVALFTEDAPKPIPEMGRYVQGQLEQPLRNELLAKSQVDSMNTQVAEMNKRAHAATQDMAKLETGMKQEKLDTKYEADVEQAKLTAGSETAQQQLAYKQLQTKLEEQRKDYNTAQESKMAAQEARELGDTASVFGPATEAPQLGAATEAARSSRIQAITTRERRAWGKADNIAAMPENSINIIEQGQPVSIAGPVYMGPASLKMKLKIGPLQDVIHQLIPAAERAYSATYKSLEPLLNGKKVLSWIEAREAMSALYELSQAAEGKFRNKAEGLAASVRPILQEAIETSVKTWAGGEDAYAAVTRGRAYTTLRHETFERGPNMQARIARTRYQSGDIPSLVLSKTPQWDVVDSIIKQTGQRQLPAIRRMTIDVMLERAEYNPAKFASIVGELQRLRPEMIRRIFTKDQQVILDSMGMQYPRTTIPKGAAIQKAPPVKVSPNLPEPPAKLKVPTVPEPAAALPEISYVHFSKPVADMAGLLKKEPVEVFRTLVKEGDKSIETLRDLDTVAPSIKYELSKTVVEEIIQSNKPADWFRLGYETRNHLAGEIRPHLDALFGQWRDAIVPNKGIKGAINKLLHFYTYRQIPGGFGLRVGGSSTGLFETPIEPTPPAYPR